MSSSDNDGANSEFERDDGSNGENIDNIIHQILEGDDLFKKNSESPGKNTKHNSSN